jgi:hypothetical protein
MGQKMISDVFLKPDQEELLTRLVEADRSLPYNQRGSFLFIQTVQDDFIRHPGLPDGYMLVQKGNVHALHDEGLLRVIRQGSATWFFDVSANGLSLYEEIETRAHSSAVEELGGLESGA